MAKRKTKTKNITLSKTKLLSLFLLVFLFAFLASGTSYFLLSKKDSTKNNSETITKQTTVISETKKELISFQETKLKEFEEIKTDLTKKVEEKTKNISDNFEEKTEEFKKDYIYEPKVKKETNIISKEKDVTLKKDLYKYNKKDKPKLAIVIDDVSNKYQKKNILSVGQKITMSFLPPTKQHKNSAKIAQDLPFHMIHFPMQASKAFKSTEKGTLTINHTYEQIEQKVKKLRVLYPKVLYTNNHTGSVFTKNEKSMEYLFRALKKYNFIFVDSRTTAKSKAEKLAKKYNMPYIVRNTFLDNKRNFSYVQGQLKKAIKIAKQRGYAVAIGHPYKITIKVLKESKDLLKDVELIYLDELPYL